MKGRERVKRLILFSVCVVCLVLAAARGGQAGEPDRFWHAGANYRSDFGTNFLRADFGLRVGALDYILVVDPMALTNNDHDIDLLFRYPLWYPLCVTGWSFFGGGRLSIVPIGREYQYHEKLLIGTSGLLPSVGTERVRIHGGIELAVHLVRHGAGLPTVWVCVDSPDCRRRHFVFSLFARVEYAGPF